MAVETDSKLTECTACHQATVIDSNSSEAMADCRTIAAPKPHRTLHAPPL